MMINQGPQNDLDIWQTLKRFNIDSLSELTETIMAIEQDAEIRSKYAGAYAWIKEFESMLRSHIYTEYHAQEYLDDAETAHPS